MTYDIDASTRGERRALIDHPLFESIRTIEDVRLLMETHVYAVWDFMSLLKRLQRDLTCVSVPWTPPAHSTMARLINEIVIGEECDENPQGGFTSHLDLYLAALREIGAQTGPFNEFLAAMRRGADLDQALQIGHAPPAARAFVRRTMDVVHAGRVEEVLAWFFFGREDIIPDMFGRLLQAWSVPDSAVPMFTYYLRRHIEMDGEEHGPAAKRMVLELVQEPAQRERLVNAARAAIVARIELWDGVLERLAPRSERELLAVA
jgi:hypothetical protein